MIKLAQDKLCLQRRALGRAAMFGAEFRTVLQACSETLEAVKFLAVDAAGARSETAPTVSVT